MLRFIILVCITCWVVAPPAQGQLRVFDENALEERENGLVYLRGSREPYSGHYKKSDGTEEGPLVNGIRHGTWSSYYPNGAVRRVMNYVGGKLDGIFELWHVKGKRTFSGTFRQGRPDGVHTAWSPYGHVLQSTTYREGRRNGSQSTYTDDGARLVDTFWVDDLKHGDQIWYFPNGRKRWQTHYREGERHGRWIQWAESGQIIVESIWENGKMVSRSDFR